MSKSQTFPSFTCRPVLINDYVTLQWSNLTSWDGLMHYSPLGWYPYSPAAALAMFWNTQNVTSTVTATLPLYYAGFNSDAVAIIRLGEGATTNVTLSGFNASVNITLPPLGIVYLVINPA